MRLNPNWTSMINGLIRNGNKIDLTLSLNMTAKYLISRLSQEDIPFKMYNLGAGVKRITTDTDTCPCCKRRL
jgi:hypothetical protein